MKNFNSNVVGTRFGRGANSQVEWECLCGHVNKRYLVQCGLCSVQKSLALEAKAELESRNGSEKN